MPWTLLALAVLLMGLGVAPSGSAQEPSEPEEPAVQEPTQGAPETLEDTSEMVESIDGSDEAGDTEPAAGLPAMPPDGEWLQDEEGRQYFVDRLSKDGLVLLREGEGKVRISWGFTLDVVDEDEEYLYYKVYRTDHIESRPVKRGPTEEERAAILAGYRVDIEESEELIFAPAREGLPAKGQWRQGFAVADMNDDGHLDIVHGPARGVPGTPVVFLGDSKGTWRPWTQVRFPRVPFTYGDVAVADFNGDKHMDLALACHFRGILVMIGDGAGGFELWSEGIEFRPPGSGKMVSFSSRTLEIVDWNVDGRPDLLALGEGPRQSGGRRGPGGTFAGSSRGAIVYLNQGDGTWVRKTQAVEADEPGGLFGDSLAVGDFNGDGRPDFVAGSNVLGRTDILNLGLEDGSWAVSSTDLVRPLSYQRAVETADLDGDGRDEVIVAYASFEAREWRVGIDVLALTKDGEWQRRPVDVRPDTTGIYALGAGDLNGDGRPDLVALDGVGESLVYLGQEGGGFVREKSPELQELEGECRGFHIELVDYDHDGRDEVVAAFAGEPKNLYTSRDCSFGGALVAWDPSAADTPGTEASKRVATADGSR